MPSNWSDVEKTTAGGLPTMPTQAIIIGTVLGIGAISCSGFYLSMMGGNVALVPWMCVMLAVAYSPMWSGSRCYGAPNPSLCACGRSSSRWPTAL